MTIRKHFKKLVRARMEKAGESYSTARRQVLSKSELDALSAFIHQRIAYDNYAIVRKFQRRSSMATYLAVVIERLALDFSIQLWQGWTPSAEACQLGPVAVLLERLILRVSSRQPSCDSRTNRSASFLALARHLDVEVV